MIARARYRTRQRSSSFRVLFWLIRMEAIYHVIGGTLPYVEQTWWRRKAFKLYKHTGTSGALKLLAQFPHRRFTP